MTQPPRDDDTPYVVSYYNAESGEQIPADGPQPMALSAILALLDEVLPNAGSFVSVTASDESMLQFVAMDEEGTIALEVPVPRRRGGYAKMTSLKTCKDTLCNLDGTVVADRIAGLTFERW